MFVYDQQSSTTDWPPGCGGVFSTDTPGGQGQSFTPSLSAVGFIRLKLGDIFPGNSTGAIMQIDLRSDSITGPILGTSLPVEMADSFAGTADFVFVSEVPVTPEVMYYFEFRVTAGDHWCVDAMEHVYNYPRGTAIFTGKPDVSGDVWFREGIIIPEPSSLALGLFGLVVLAAAKRVCADGCQTGVERHG